VPIARQWKPQWDGLLAQHEASEEEGLRRPRAFLRKGHSPWNRSTIFSTKARASLVVVHLSINWPVLGTVIRFKRSFSTVENVIPMPPLRNNTQVLIPP